jgi:signal transduction histidine kinase
MKYLPWKDTFFFCVGAAVLLFFGERMSVVLTIWSTLLPMGYLFSFMQALFLAVLLSLPVFFLLHRRALRIRALTHVVYAWGRGDFSTNTHDMLKDEIGQLSQNLDEMAKEVQKSIETQKEISSVSGNTLLAEELHDTVKQQIFALALQISCAQKIHSSQDDQVAMYLGEAKEILHDIENDVSNLFHQSVLERQHLAEALTIYFARKYSIHHDAFSRSASNSGRRVGEIRRIYPA